MRLLASALGEDQRGFRCRACRRAFCEPCEESNGCIGGRCTCDHVDVIPDVLSIVPTPKAVKAKAPLPSGGVNRERAEANRAERAVRSTRAPGRQPAPEARQREVVEAAVRSTTKAAAAAAGVSENTVRRWAKDLGVTFPPRREYHQHYPLEVKVNAVDLAHQLGSSLEAGKQLGITHTTIAKWARKLGRPLKGKPGPPRSVGPKGPPRAGLEDLARTLQVLGPPEPALALTKETASCCLAQVDQDGRPPIGYCGPSCLRRPNRKATPCEGS